MVFSNPLVSIVMPAYNCEKYIKQTIASVLSQTYQNWELIVVNDCSTDATRAIIRQSADCDSRIKLFDTIENTRKPSKVKNIALKYARGEYLAFLDSDDWWESTKLEIQMEAMQKGNYALSHTGGFFIDEDNNIIRQFMPQCGSGHIYGELLAQYDIKNLSVIVSTKALISLDVPVFDEQITIGEDCDLFMRIAYKYEILTIYESFFYYRIHINSITRTTDKAIWDGLQKVVDDTLKLPDSYLYKKDIKMANAKISYYMAKNLMSKGEYIKAATLLAKQSFVSYKYFALFILSLSPWLWNFVHNTLKR